MVLHLAAKNRTCQNEDDDRAAFNFTDISSKLSIGYNIVVLMTINKYSYF